MPPIATHDTRIRADSIQTTASVRDEARGCPEDRQTDPALLHVPHTGAVHGLRRHHMRHGLSASYCE